MKKYNYKNILLLQKCISVSGKILPKRLNHLNTKRQRSISKAIKNARILGFLPFTRLSGNPPTIKHKHNKRKTRPSDQGQ